MRRLIRSLFVLGVILTSCANTWAQGTRDLSGTYEVRGNNANGSAYGGKAVIRMTDSSCMVYWTTESTNSHGTCRLDGDTFTVNFVLAGGKGVVVYQLKANGDLAGTWWMNGYERHKGREKLLLRKLDSPGV